jgi:hypothetical protein
MSMPASDARAACQLGFTPRETCHVGGKSVACSRGGHTVPFQVPAGSRLLAGDMFTCAVSHKEVTCWGASRDGWIGTASACPARLKAQWPTTAGFVRAPNAACSSIPAVVRGFEGIEVHSVRPPISVGPRGACAIIDKHVRCVGAIPTPSTEVATVAVNAGNRANACGIADSKVVCWGEGYSPNDNPSAAVVVNLGPPPFADAAVVDFAASEGTSWPEPYLIHRDCALPARPIPKCPAGTTGEPWSSLLARAGIGGSESKCARPSFRQSAYERGSPLLLGRLQPQTARSVPPHRRVRNGGAKYRSWRR